MLHLNHVLTWRQQLFLRIKTKTWVCNFCWWIYVEHSRYVQVMHQYEIEPVTLSSTPYLWGEEQMANIWLMQPKIKRKTQKKLLLHNWVCGQERNWYMDMVTNIQWIKPSNNMTSYTSSTHFLQNKGGHFLKCQSKRSDMYDTATYACSSEWHTYMTLFDPMLQGQIHFRLYLDFLTTQVFYQWLISHF